MMVFILLFQMMSVCLPFIFSINKLVCQMSQMSEECVPITISQSPTWHLHAAHFVQQTILKPNTVYSIYCHIWLKSGAETREWLTSLAWKTGTIEPIVSALHWPTSVITIGVFFLRYVKVTYISSSFKTFRDQLKEKVLLQKKSFRAVAGVRCPPALSV